MAAMLNVSKVLSMCCNSDFSHSEDESSCDEGEEAHAYRGPRVIAPEKVESLSRDVTSEPIESSSSSTSESTDA